MFGYEFLNGVSVIKTSFFGTNNSLTFISLLGFVKLTFNCVENFIFHVTEGCLDIFIKWNSLFEINNLSIHSSNFDNLVFWWLISGLTHRGFLETELFDTWEEFTYMLID